MFQVHKKLPNDSWKKIQFFFQKWRESRLDIKETARNWVLKKGNFHKKN